MSDVNKQALGRFDWFWDESARTLYGYLDKHQVLKITKTDMQFNIASQARGDIIRRGASTWERVSAKTAGQILVGDGTDVASVAVSGDATLSSAGALTVTDVTVGSDAAGDLLYKSSATALARLAKGTAGQRLAMNSGATAPNWVDHAEKWPMRIGASVGIDTDGYNGGIAVGDQAADLALTDEGNAFNKGDDGGSFADINGISAEAGYTANWQLFPDTELENDAVYFGGATPFCELYLDVVTAGVYGADSCLWEYYNGSSWATLTNFSDCTDSTGQDGKRPFQQDGCLVFHPPSDWAASTIDSQEAYWLRSRVVAGFNITTIPILNSVNGKTVAPTDGFKVPDTGTITDIRLIDEAGTPHTATDIKFFLMNFTTGAASSVLTFAQDQRQDAWASLTLAVTEGDFLGAVIVQEDGTNEMGPVTLEIGATLSV